jgi:MOSC domain-containing protein YiiM
MNEHRVLKLWVRPQEGGPLEERDALTVEEGQGIVGDHTLGRLRHVSIVFEDDWNSAAREIGKQPDPIGRRANVLLSGGNGQRHVKTQIRLGEVLLDVKGELAPCPIMEQAAEGMHEALKPNGRGGIWGRVVRGGEIRRGETLEESPGKS